MHIDRLVVQSNGSLTIQDVQFSDSAVYQCVAENEAGSTSDQMHLKLKSKSRDSCRLIGLFFI